jgi:hypothetical protein
VAGYVRSGNGLAVFMPFEIGMTGDGERFWANLREFSAGYPVPPPIR